MHRSSYIYSVFIGSEPKCFIDLFQCASLFGSDAIKTAIINNRRVNRCITAVVAAIYLSAFAFFFHSTEWSIMSEREVKKILLFIA